MVVTYKWVSKATSGKIKRRRRFVFHSLDENFQVNCQICGKKMTFNPERRDCEISVDHIIPQARGGADCNDNYLIACKPCNVKKGAMTMEEFLDMIDYVNGVELTEEQLKRLVEAYAIDRLFKKGK